MRTALVGIQAATFAGLAALFAVEHNWRFATAQSLLCAITVVLYS